MDSDWIKNLAEAKVVKGSFVPHDTDEIKRQVTATLVDAMNDLIRELEAAVNLFNTYRHHEQISLISLEASGQSHRHGMILIWQGYQLIVEQLDYRIDVYASVGKGFEKRRKKLHTLTPKIDVLGEVLWKLDGKSNLTLEMVGRYLLKLLCLNKHAW